MILISYNDFLNEVHTLNDSEILKNIEKSFNIVNTKSFGILNNNNKRDLNDAVIDELKANFNKEYDNCNFVFTSVNSLDIISKEIFSALNNGIQMLNPKQMGLVGMVDGRCTVESNNNKINYNISIIFNENFTDNYIKDKDKYMSALTSIIKHEMIHKEQFSLIINKLKKINININNDDIVLLFNNKANKIVANKKSYSSGFGKIMKDLSFISDNNQYIKYIDTVDIVNSAEDLEDLVDEVRLQVISIDILTNTIKNYNVHEIIKNLNEDPDFMFKKYNKELTKYNKAQLISHIINHLNDSISHDALKLELDADGYTIAHELEKSLGKQKAKEYISKPISSKNTPSNIFNYYINVFGLNTKPIKDLKNKIAKYLIK